MPGLRLALSFAAHRVERGVGAAHEMEVIADDPGVRQCGADRVAVGVVGVDRDDSPLEFRPPSRHATRSSNSGAVSTVAAALQADLLAARARAIARRMFATGPVLGLLWSATLAPPLLARHGRPAAATVAVAVMLAAAAESLTAATLTIQGPRLVPFRRAAWLERIAPTTIAIATTAATLIDTAALSALILTVRAEAISPSAVAVSAAAGVATSIRLPLAARATCWAWGHRTRNPG
jgi:hypothetical protein